MTQKTVSMADKVAVVGRIDPGVQTAGTYTTGWISMVNFQQVMAIVQAGTLGASATLDAKLEQASDGAGTGVKDIMGAAITQLTQAGGDSDKDAKIAIHAEDLDAVNDFTHVRLSMTVGTATSDAGAVVLGMSERYGPASAFDASSVVEIVRL